MSLFRPPQGYHILACILITAAALVLAAGCTQAQAPLSPPAQTAEKELFKEVTATQPDDSRIVVTYEGGPNMERIIELETTITDSTGKSVTRSAGSRLATTPIPIKGTNTISGNFAGKDHVVVTAHMIDGSRTTVLDTTI
jgi:hypothetical protein